MNYKKKTLIFKEKNCGNRLDKEIKNIDDWPTVLKHQDKTIIQIKHKLY